MQDLKLVTYRGTRHVPFFDADSDDTCAVVRNISQLPPGASPGGPRLCSYTMGALLFYDLRRNLGELDFRRGFRQLYLLSTHDVLDDECEGTFLSVCHVTVAFTADVLKEKKAVAVKVIDEWYQGDFPRYWADTDDVPWINGVVSGADGNPVAGLELVLWEEPFGEKDTTGPDGAFGFYAIGGTFNLQVVVPQGCDFGSWYDGAGFSFDRADAVDLVQDGSVFHPLDIEVPITSDDLHCGWRTIRGTILGADGLPGIPGGQWILINAYEADSSPDLSNAYSGVWSQSWIDRGYNATFEVFVPDGTHSLYLRGSSAGNSFDFGWFDGKGITLDRDQAMEVKMDGADVEGLEIMLPKVPPTAPSSFVESPPPTWIFTGDTTE